MNYGTQNWEPDSFFDEAGDPFSPDHIAAGFDLDPSEYSSYFPKYDDWKTEFAEAEYGVDVEEYTASKTLLKQMKDAQSGRIEEKKGEAGTSLAQGLGATYSQAATQYADVAKQSINQQVSFTSGVTGRQQEEAFERTQESLMQNTMEQNLAFTSTSRDLEQATTELDAQYEFDLGKVGRDLEKAEIDKDYKTKASEKAWEDSIYDTLKSLTSVGAWEEEEDPDHDSYQWYNPADWFGHHDD